MLEFFKKLQNNCLKKSLRFGVYTTNNETEYKALISNLMLGKSLGATTIAIKSDSQLVVNQVKSISNAKDPNKAKY